MFVCFFAVVVCLFFMAVDDRNLSDGRYVLAAGEIIHNSNSKQNRTKKVSENIWQATKVIPTRIPRDTDTEVVTIV